MYSRKQKAASMRNWRLGQARNIEDYLRRRGYPVTAKDIGDLLRSDAELQWQRDKEAIDNNPNYNVPY